MKSCAHLVGKLELDRRKSSAGKIISSSSRFTHTHTHRRLIIAKRISRFALTSLFALASTNSARRASSWAFAVVRLSVEFLQWDQLFQRERGKKDIGIRTCLLRICFSIVQFLVEVEFLEFEIDSKGWPIIEEEWWTKDLLECRLI